MMTTDEMTATELKDVARALANDLFRSGGSGIPCTGVHNQETTCLRAEEERPLTKAEKQKGWSRRPFHAYDTDRLCLGCRAYYFAEQAAQAIERHVVLAKVAER